MVLLGSWERRASPRDCVAVALGPDETTQRWQNMSDVSRARGWRSTPVKRLKQASRREETVICVQKLRRWASEYGSPLENVKKKYASRHIPLSIAVR